MEEISDLHLDEISLNHCGKWRFLCSFLKLPQILVEDLDRSALQENEKRRIFFKEWKLRKGSEATYQELTNALLKIDCKKDAEYVISLAGLRVETLEGRPPASSVSRRHIKGIRVTEKDISFLTFQLSHYAHKWDVIGTALNFRREELDNIEYSPEGWNMQERLREMLTQWCQGTARHRPDPPTLEGLCDALKSKLVCLGTVAEVVYASRDQLPSRQVKDPVSQQPIAATSNPSVTPATKNPAPPHQPDYIPLKIVLFIILIFVLILTMAYSIPLVVEYSMLFVYGIALVMVISLFLAGYYFAEHMN